MSAGLISRVLPVAAGILLAGASLPLESVAQTPRVKRPATVTTDCTAGECHADVKSFTVLHGPLTVGACAGCHRHEDPKKHTFEMARPGDRLCLFCHRRETGLVSHLDQGEGGCLGCHNPHGGQRRGLLRTESTQQLCLRCHQKDMEQGRLAHRPVAAGGCMACHTPHVSDHRRLLIKEPRLLCLDCHVGLSHRVEWSRVVHEPLSKGCLDCHKAHASDEEKLLAAPPKRLCLSCHEDIRSTIEHAKTDHGALVEGRECLNCHDSHATDFPKLLRSNARRLCLQCHDKPIETPQGTIADIGEVLSTGRSLHGPIAADDCSSCHQIHGGDGFRLLIKEYPNEFYAPFREESYALCFSCHERSVVLTPRTTTLTSFRNGDRNLHFAHVNRRTKGRTCRACHETHAADRAKHVREYVPFGDWKLPVGFRKTETGGTCASGCHKVLAYDRERPVEYEHEEGKPLADWPPRAETERKERP